MRKLFLALCVLIAIVVIITGCSKQDAEGISEELPSSKVVEVTFDKPVDLSVLSDIISKDIHIVQFRAIMIDNTGKKITHGQSLADDEVVNIEDIHDDAITYFDRQAELEKQSIISGNEQGIPEEYLQPTDYSNRKITQVKLSYVMLEMSAEQRAVVEPLLKSLGGEFNEWDQEKQSSLEIRSRDRSWVPNIGNVRTDEYSSTKRYVYQRARWLTRNPFNRWETYEHDFFLNNYDTNRGTYLSREQNSLGFPICTWESDLPSPYLDTRFNDPAEEVAYTIGSGDAYDIEEEEWYYTYIRVRNGDVNEDKGKLTAQLGNQIPIGCTSSWCSFPVANVRLISAWKVEIPGYQRWYYEL